MEKQVKTPFFWPKLFNLILGVAILILLLAVIFIDESTSALEIWIFALAAVENFVAATISFAEHKKMLGNVCAVACAVFLVAALVMAVFYFGVI